MSNTMKAIAVTSYGPIPNLKAIEVPKPSNLQSHDILVRIRGCSVNPVDTKVRAGTYDDYPGYYSRTPKLPQMLGFDASGIVDSMSVAFKPINLDWGQTASMPLTWITAWEALVERIGIQEGENAGILIGNGAGGVGSVASQIARKVLKLPVVITTASREETGAATHTVNHREDIVK